MTQHVINAENVCEFDCQDLPLMSRLHICLAVLSGGILKLRSRSLTINTLDEEDRPPASDHAEQKAANAAERGE